MNPKSFMVIAGEASGDLLAAELIPALREELAIAEVTRTGDAQPLYASLAPRFFGAGGPRMASAGVELAFDMTAHSVIGLSDVFKNYFTFRRLFYQLYELALARTPDAILCVDFSGFNRRFAHAIKEHVRSRLDWFHPWNPKIIQYVSPQVWASREGRARQMNEDCDLLLSIFPFEKAWYAKRVPQLPVVFVGHPLVDRYNLSSPAPPAATGSPRSLPTVLLLPGSRPGELRRHLPLLVEAAKKIRAVREVAFRIVLPQESLAAQARPSAEQVPGLRTQIGGLEEALRDADLALTKSGTITMECACFGVPAVVFYKTSTLNYLAARQLVKVKYLAMPNLLVDEPIFPEFIQQAATPDNIARAALELLNDQARRQKVKTRLAEIVATLGTPGASRRAARAVVELLHPPAELNLSVV